MKLDLNKILITFGFAIIISAIIVMTSCKANKPISEFKQEVKSDSLREEIKTNKETVKSLPISDITRYFIPTISTNISKGCDSVCNEKLLEVIKQFNRTIESGNNRFSLLYDENSRYLIATAEMEQTVSMLQDSIFKLNKTKSKVTSAKEIVEVKVYPKWLVYLAIMGGLFIVFLAYRFSRIFM